MGLGCTPSLHHRIADRHGDLRRRAGRPDDGSALHADPHADGAALHAALARQLVEGELIAQIVRGRAVGLAAIASVPAPVRMSTLGQSSSSCRRTGPSADAWAWVAGALERENQLGSAAAKRRAAATACRTAAAANNGRQRRIARRSRPCRARRSACRSSKWQTVPFVRRPYSRTTVAAPRPSRFGQGGGSSRSRANNR